MIAAPMPPLEVGGTVLSLQHVGTGCPYIGRVEEIRGDRVGVRMRDDGIRRVVGVDWLTPWPAMRAGRRAEP